MRRGVIDAPVNMTRACRFIDAAVAVGSGTGDDRLRYIEREL